MRPPLNSWPSRSRAPALGALIVAACVVAALPGHAAGRQALHGHVPEVISRLAPVGRLRATQRLSLAIALPLRNQPALTQLVRQLYDPASPAYRHFLTPAQFTAQFGPSAQDYEAVAAFARAHGLTVTGRHPNRVVLDVEGTVANVENALHVTLRVYRHPREARTFYAPDAEPSLDLAAPIARIAGLDTYAPPQPRVHVLPAGRAAGASPNTGSGPGGGYMGNDFRAAYAPGVALTGTGQTVGLLQFDGYKSSDITYYENLAGLPKVTLTNVLLDGFNGNPTNTDGPVEVSLDIEMVVSMAPGLSKVIVYEAGPNGNWYDLLNRMATDNLAKQLSCSWYIPGGTEDPVADGIFQQMATQGQSFYSASGDSDAFTGLIPFPGDTPYITEVGGTTLTDNGTGGSWNSETAWNWGYDSNANGYVGTGGGISTQYSIPAWQQGVSMATNGGSTTMRNVPDVALTADNIYVRQGSSNQNVGGTSCAAPLWAGFTALVNQQAVANGFSTVGFVNPAIYAIGSSSTYTAAFHDTTTGNNTSSSSPNQFYAVAGYDLCTGWGTPTGAALINALAGPPEAMQVSSPSFAAAGSVGGPFAPGATSYTVTNIGSSTLAWSASKTQPWLSLSATGGTLVASGSATVTASINASANVLATGTYSDTITFTDPGTGSTQNRAVSLTVVAAVPVITSTLAATATNGAAFSYQITATNNPSSFAASGLPAGLSINAAGLISGSTTATGIKQVTLKAINSSGTGSATLVLTVLPPPPVITSPVTTTAISNAAFSYQITATNSPTSFGASGLPSGLSVNSTTGLITGTATGTGTNFVTVSAANAGGTGSAIVAITLLPPLPVITSALAATATSGVAFSYEITATNSATGFGATGLPAGLGVDPATGLISGTTSVTGASYVTLDAVNSSGTGSATLALTVFQAPPVITSALQGTGTTGEPFAYQITATNNPTSFGATGLPGGLSVNTSSGLISGTLTSTGTTNVTISAANSAGPGTATLVIAALSPYAAWQSEYFSASNLANQTVSGDTADPAGDGIPNLMKYALNLNPYTDGVSGMPVESVVRTRSGYYLELTYTQVIAATDITYTVQVSGDLQTWSSGKGYTSQVSATNNPDGITQSVTVQSVTPLSGTNPTLFIRLQVTKSN